MELNDQERALINDLINIAWQSGAVKSPQTGMLIEQLRVKLQKTAPRSPVDGREEMAPMKQTSLSR